MGEFYSGIGPRDVLSAITNQTWPYTLEFYIRSNRYNIVGRIVGENVGGLEVRKYYLA